VPQIRLEYTSNLDPVPHVDTLLDDVHRALNTIAGVKLDNCKSRVNVLDRFYVADGAADHAFVHLEVRLLEGRSDSVKQELGNALLEGLKRYFDVEQTGQRVQATVEIADILRDGYFKYTG
jgi:5-carboxymethyl-2-hydroxymuconate isomerase